MNKCFPLPPNWQLAIYSVNWFDLCNQSLKWTLAKWQMWLKLGLWSWNLTLRTLYTIKIKDDCLKVVDRFGWVKKPLLVFWCVFCSHEEHVCRVSLVSFMLNRCSYHVYLQMFYLICFWFSSVHVPSGLFSVMVHNIWLNDKEKHWATIIKKKKKFHWTTNQKPM